MARDGQFLFPPLASMTHTDLMSVKRYVNTHIIFDSDCLIDIRGMSISTPLSTCIAYPMTELPRRCMLKDLEMFPTLCGVKSSEEGGKGHEDELKRA